MNAALLESAVGSLRDTRLIVVANREPYIHVRQTRPAQGVLNWFRAEGTISSGTVEGFNNKAKLTIRKSYGFRTEQGIGIALFHTLGKLPEPKLTHRFC